MNTTKRRTKRREEELPVRLPWGWDDSQFHAVLSFVRDRVYAIYRDRLGISKALVYGVSKAGEIIGAKSPAALRRKANRLNLSSIAFAYALPETLNRLDRQGNSSRIRGGPAAITELLIADDALFLVETIERAVKKNDAAEAAQALTRLWINSTVAGWTADFYPKARRLFDGHKRRIEGGRDGGEARSRLLESRNAKIRKHIQDRINSGAEYSKIIASLARTRNWPDEWGAPIKPVSLRNAFPKKTFTHPSHS